MDSTEKSSSFFSRKSPRIEFHDYSGGDYFITICTRDKEHYFGKIINGEMEFTELGRYCQQQIASISVHYPYAEPILYVVMPNHVHMIIVLGNSGKNDLNQVIGQFKSGVSREIRNMEPAMRVWQRSYYDHVIRNEKSYREIWEYIEYNPLKWEEDRFYSKDQKM